jgi:hypothetical protein
MRNAHYTYLQDYSMMNTGLIMDCPGLHIYILHILLVLAEGSMNVLELNRILPIW